MYVYMYTYIYIYIYISIVYSCHTVYIGHYSHGNESLEHPFHDGTARSWVDSKHGPWWIATVKTLGGKVKIDGFPITSLGRLVEGVYQIVYWPIL